jgi:hypothetical protein
LKDYFMAGLKYEKNPQTKATISARVEGYMKRAEDLKAVVDKDRAAAANKGKKGGGGGGTATRNPGEDEEKEDEEKNKLKGALSSSIVTEKPNVKWDDVAGLDGAKEALKEAVCRDACSLPPSLPPSVPASFSLWYTMSLLAFLLVNECRFEAPFSHIKFEPRHSHSPSLPSSLPPSPPRSSSPSSFLSCLSASESPGEASSSTDPREQGNRSWPRQSQQKPTASSSPSPPQI